MSRKRIILIVSLLLPILVLGACGKRSALKRMHEPAKAAGTTKPSGFGTTTEKNPEMAPVLPGAVMPGAVLPDTDRFGTNQ